MVVRMTLHVSLCEVEAITTILSAVVCERGRVRGRVYGTV